ncbi:potassium channel family protein [Microbacterium thalassium]|uniref:Voltage-gated potassium channel n=1 Tax=Microbacterium thalassium TaxID=362649 RepID=A0A7X0KV03_9MICO|nr:potassium channel family protein [Microbacterium thalassium]MBB6391726.1 voltage-gated potassium channel [Microbacterium thalassium]GLK24329.1 voltage-gated potassium channel [Microbacterium thalassium]
MTRQERWQNFADWPLFIASLLFLAAYAWDVLDQPSGAAESLADIVLWATWGLFVIDYVANLVLVESDKRWRWFYTHLIDLAVVALPMLRALRLLRLLTLLRVLDRVAGRAVRGSLAIYMGGASVLLIVVGALAVLDAERTDPAASIRTFGEALWWAFVTMTTVGYGDYSPVTATGQIIAVVLMLGGIALLGVVTGSIASWIVEKVSDADAEQAAATAGHIHQLEDKVDQLQAMLREVLERDAEQVRAAR